MHNIKSVGSTGLALLGKGNSKELELEAADAATRDVWVSGTENEEREKWNSHWRFKEMRRTEVDCEDVHKCWCVVE